MRTKKTLAILLAMVLVMSMLPLTALAETPGDLVTFTINSSAPANATGEGAAGASQTWADLATNQATLTLTTSQLTDEQPPTATYVGGAGSLTIVRHIPSASISALETSITSDGFDTALSGAHNDASSGWGTIADGDLIAVQVNAKWWFFLIVEDSSNGGDLQDHGSEAHDGGGGGLVPEVSYEQKKVATLPTSAGFNFVLDPQGLYYLDDEAIEALVVDPEGSNRLGTMNGSTWEPLASAGQIIFSPYSPYFVNNSNFDMALEIEFTFTDGDEDDLVIAVDDPNEVEDGDNALIFIGATFSTLNVNETPSGFSGDLTLPVLAADEFGEGQTPLFLLDAAEYADQTDVTRDNADIITKIEVERKKNMAEGFTGSGTQFMFSGKCNPDANWTEIFAEPEIDLAISVVFTLTGPSPDSWEFSVTELSELTAGDPILKAFGLVEGNSLVAGDFVTLSAPLTETFLTSDERKADIATGIADDAALAVTRELTGAIAVLETAMDTFGTDDLTAPLEEAIGVAETALDTATTARDAADDAIAEARDADLHEESTPIYDKLVAARGRLNTAIEALTEKIAEAKKLLGSEPGFEADTFKHDVTGTWFDVPFNYDGDTVASVMLNNTTPLTQNTNWRQDKSGDNIIEFNFSSLVQRVITVIMQNGERYTIIFNQVGFTSSTFTDAPGGIRFSVPFIYDGWTVTSAVVAPSVSLILNTNYWVNTAGDEIEFQFSNTNERVVTVTLSNAGVTQTSVITINPAG